MVQLSSTHAEKVIPHCIDILSIADQPCSLEGTVWVALVAESTLSLFQ